MDNVKLLNKDSVTPQTILHSVHEDLEMISEIFYIISFHKDGSLHEHVSGSASGMCLAGSVLQQSALEHISQ